MELTTIPPLPEPGVQSPEDRRAISMGFIRDAREELEHGSRLQAGEKAWGAVAQYLKLIGEQRGWMHHSHNHLENIARHIVREYGSPEFGYALANAYNIGHKNFYENLWSLRTIRETIEDVEEIMPILESIAFGAPRLFTITSQRDRRRLIALTGNNALQVGDTSPVGFSLRHSPDSANGGAQGDGR